MSRLHHRVPEIQSEVQHVFSEDMLHLRGETCQIRSVWLANYALVLSDVSHRNPRAYDRRKNKQLLRALLTCAEAHLRQIDEDERMI